MNRQIAAVFLFFVCLGSAQWQNPPTSGYPALNTFLQSLTATQISSITPTTCTTGKDFWLNTGTTPATLEYCDTTNHWTPVALSAGSILLSGTLAAIPPTCTPGAAIYQATDQPAGLQMNACTATNTWTRISYSQGSTNPATCSVGQWFFNTAATAGQNIQLCTSTNTWTQVAGGSSVSGTVTYTSSHTMSSADNGLLVQMNCSSACTVTLPNPQPSSTWASRVVSIGSTVATVALGSGMTFNRGSSVPVLNSFRQMALYSDTGLSTNYAGEAPIACGSGLTCTPSANAFSMSAPAGGGGLGSANCSVLTVTSNAVTLAYSSTVNCNKFTITAATTVTLPTPTTGSGSYSFEVINSGPVTGANVSYAGATETGLPTTVDASSNNAITTCQMNWDNAASQWVSLGCSSATAAQLSAGQIPAQSSTGPPVAATASNLSAPLDGGTGGGTAQAQTVTLSPAATSLTNLHFRYKPNVANTGAAPTIAVNGLTAKPVTKCGTTALVAGDLAVGVYAELTYDGTEFQLLNPQAAACGASGASISDAGGSSRGNWAPWPSALLFPQSHTLTPGTLYMAELPANSPLLTTTGMWIKNYNGGGSGHMAFAIYNAAGTTLLAYNSGVANCGSCIQEYTWNSSFQFQINTTYLIAWSGDDTLGSYYGQEMDVLASPAAPRIFSCANTVTWSAGSATFPATCGARSANGVNNIVPGVFFVN